jgi:hypothetical protein
MDLQNPRTQALILRFILGLVLTDIPVITYQLQQPTFDWKFLAIGLLGGLGAYLEKFFAPQLADTILPDAQPVQPPPH